jgi:hypothetical protein
LAFTILLNLHMHILVNTNGRHQHIWPHVPRDVYTFWWIIDVDYLSPQQVRHPGNYFSTLCTTRSSVTNTRNPNNPRLQFSCKPIVPILPEVESKWVLDPCLGIQMLPLYPTTQIPTLWNMFNEGMGSNWIKI